MFKTSGFEKLLDKATSNLLMEPDWPTILQICDLIRQDDVQPRTALNAIKKKLISQNPHTALYALQLLESMVKNCGATVHDELTTKQFCELLHELTKTTPHENVRQKLLELIQAWNFAFRKNPKHANLKEIMTEMKAEGFKFPTLRESDAMFTADTAPEWVDGEVCHRCRVQFGMVQRKHHCRACGQVFCSQCSQKTMSLPKFGIEKEVRVCDACYDQFTKPSTVKVASDKEYELPPEYLKSSLSQQNQAPPRKNEDELREEEELQLALALSQSEAEAKEKEKMRATSAFHSIYKTEQQSAPAERSPSPDEAPELARYLNRQYWENRQVEPADANTNARTISPSVPASAPIQNVEIKYKENGITDIAMEDFVNTLKSQVEIFINRMKSNSSRGRSIATDSSVQTLFMNLTSMHSQLLRYIQQHDDSRLFFERLQDKLTQVKDARAALDALREEHREKLRRQAEEAERQRQLQMAHKLEIMRIKKQEYLQYQRQLALQRIHEQEREMEMRQEQQKQQYMIGPQYGNFIGSPVHGQQFPPPSAASSVGTYGYQYAQPTMIIPQGPPPQGAPQLAHSGPTQGIQPPPGFPPIPQGMHPPQALQQQPQNLHPHPNMPPQGGPPLPAMGQGPPSLRTIGQGPIPNLPPGLNHPNQSIPIGPQHVPPHSAASKPMINQPSQPQFQQPGAPPASPQISSPQQTDTQTAELISFD